MFGFKKKPVRPNPLWDNIHEKMRYELHHNNDEERQSYDDRYDDVPFFHVSEYANCSITLGLCSTSPLGN